MQPPSEADIVSATDSLRRQKEAVDGQAAALLDLAACLEEIVKEGKDEHDRTIPACTSRFLRCYVMGLTENSTALGAAIQHNERALQAVRSNILLPNIRTRNIPQ